jgi:phosphate transport system substrate-binding protein
MKLKSSIRLATLAFLGVATFALAVGCSDDDDNGGSTGGATGASPTATTAAGTGATGATGGTDGSSEDLSGRVVIDGSSTVFPVTEAVAEEFNSVQPDVQVPVGVSGTGGGFEKFCRGETDISDASRPIDLEDSEEVPACEAAGIEFIEIPVAYDGLSVVVNPANDWVSCITVEELNLIWRPDSEGVITRWNQVNPEWPDEPLNLYGAGTDSGTYDYFVEVIADGDSRPDFTPSEDDNVLVQGVAGDPNAMGFFGLAYLEENRGRIVGLEVDNGEGCVEANAETVEAGEYAPLSRPIFIYVNAEAAERPEVQAFVDFYLENAGELSSAVGYVQFPEEFYEAITERWEARTTGTIFSDASGSVAEILGVE